MDLTKAKAEIIWRAWDELSAIADEDEILTVVVNDLDQFLFNHKEEIGRM